MAQTEPQPEPQEVGEQSLDGAKDVLLAPVRGPDTRSKLPDEFFERRPARFAGKFGFAIGVIALCLVLIATTSSAIVVGLSVVVLGLMYGHLVELQHECLHEHAFRSRRLNRLLGFLSGVAMLSSFSHYKYEHLRHHAFLGTPRNQEFFNYRFRGLDSWHGFLRAAFNLSRYVDVIRFIALSVAGRPIPRVARQSTSTPKIRAEYRLMFVLVVAAVVYTVATQNPFFVFAWLLPIVLAAEATHFMIELPEHFGLNTQTDDNVLTNTRTIDASKFAQWFTNYNNYHTAHHYHQGVPMANAPRLNQLAGEKWEVVEPSYWTFYRKVLRGEVKYAAENETCMTR